MKLVAYFVFGSLSGLIVGSMFPSVTNLSILTSAIVGACSVFVVDFFWKDVK